MVEEKQTKWKAASDAFVARETKEMKKILDVGAGMYHHPDAVTTVDIRPESGADIIADIQDGINLAAESFDCIVLNNVMEHLKRPDDAILECKRLLKRGGKIIVAVPFLIKIHQEPIDYGRYTIYKLEDFFKDFKTTITPYGTLTDLYKNIQQDLFGLIGRKRIFAWCVSRIITFLSFVLPDISYIDYPRGYFIVAVKK